MNSLSEIKDINNQFKSNLTEKADLFPHIHSISLIATVTILSKSL